MALVEMLIGCVGCKPPQLSRALHVSSVDVYEITGRMKCVTVCTYMYIRGRNRRIILREEMVWELGTNVLRSSIAQTMALCLRSYLTI
jgi:hypothetical protein